MLIPIGGYEKDGVIYTQNDVPCMRTHGEGIDFNYVKAQAEYHRKMANMWHERWEKDKKQNQFMAFHTHDTEANVWEQILIALCTNKENFEYGDMPHTDGEVRYIKCKECNWMDAE